MVWRVDSGQGRAGKSEKVESGGFGYPERREDGGRPRAGVVGGQESVLRRKKEQLGFPGIQSIPPAPAPRQQPSAETRAFMGVLNPETEQ